MVGEEGAELLGPVGENQENVGMKPDFSWTASSRSRISAGMSDKAGTGKRLMGAWEEVVMGRVSYGGSSKKPAGWGGIR